MNGGPEPDGQAGPRDWGAWPEAEPAAPPRRPRRARRAGRDDADAGSGAGRDRAAAEPARPDDPVARAQAICLRLLTAAPRTRAQLAEALRRRKVPEEAAQTVLERLAAAGMIDDEAFARAWVSSRHHGRGLARRALAAELRQRGVAEDTVDEAVAELDPAQEAETARALVARRLPATRGLDPVTRARRLTGMLARKGYSPGLSFRIVREALEAEGVDEHLLPEEPY